MAVGFNLMDVVDRTHHGTKSVWDLKQIAFNCQDFRKSYLTTNPLLVPAVSVDYGLLNCKGNENEGQELIQVYNLYYEHPDGDPIKLHLSAVAGKLFKCVSSVINIGTNKKRVKHLMQRLMKNPNPVSDI
jgi:hypothetical protein